jgi:hypothetical protein
VRLAGPLHLGVAVLTSVPHAQVFIVDDDEGVVTALSRALRLSGL